MASLQRLGSDTWRVKVYVDGKSYSRNFAATSERAAKQKMAAVEMDIRDAIRTPSSTTMHIADLVNDWLAVCTTRGLSPSTMRSYQMHADRFTARFGRRLCDELTGRDIDAWYAEMIGDGKSAATIQHTHRVVRAILNFGHGSRDLGRVATKQSHPPTYRQPEVSPPTSELVRELLASVTGEWGRAVRLLAMTGIRRGEVVGLRWADVGDTSITVALSVLAARGGGAHIKETKGRRVRKVAIGPAATAVLDEQRRVVAERCERAEIAMSPWVFPAWLVDPMRPRRPDWVSLMWGRHRAAHDADSVRLHDLRHWYATTALEGGVPLSSVSAQLGHAQTSTTANIYAHATDAGRDRAAATVEGALG